MPEAKRSETENPVYKIKVVNQFGVEVSHNLCDEDGNLNATLASGKPGEVNEDPFNFEAIF